MAALVLLALVVVARAAATVGNDAIISIESAATFVDQAALAKRAVMRRERGGSHLEPEAPDESHLHLPASSLVELEAKSSLGDAWLLMSGKCTPTSIKKYGTGCSSGCESDAATITTLQLCKNKCSGYLLADGTECKAVAWGMITTAANYKECQLLIFPGSGVCADSGSTYDQFTYMMRLGAATLAAGVSSDERCNDYTCPAGYYRRKEAPEISCVAATCTAANDKNRCCKALTTEVTGYRCDNTQALNWSPAWTMQQCVTWAINNGVTFFVYGKGAKSQRCWWQRSTAPLSCTGNSCCAGTGASWVSDDFDFYKLV